MPLGVRMPVCQEKPACRGVLALIVYTGGPNAAHGPTRMRMTPVELHSAKVWISGEVG